MKVLAIETSSYCGSVALVEDGEVLGEVFFNIGPKNSEKIVLSIDWLIKNLNIPKDQINAVAVSKGPGSFTSLRVGVSIAKGISYSLGIDIVGVPSSRIIASNCAGINTQICTLIDAKRKEVYASLFNCKNGNLCSLVDDKIVRVEELNNFIDDETLFVGSGALIYRDTIAEIIEPKSHFAPELVNYPRASHCGLLAYTDIISGKKDNVFTLAPDYIRKPDVESSN